VDSTFEFVLPVLVMENEKRFGTCLWHIATAFRGKEKMRLSKGKLGRNAVPSFGPDLVMDDTH
jgi:hypothetical protein